MEKSPIIGNESPCGFVDVWQIAIHPLRLSIQGTLAPDRLYLRPMSHVVSVRGWPRLTVNSAVVPKWP